VGRTVASQVIGWRKVRAGQGTVVANSHQGQPSGKCHRKHTADGPKGPVWKQIPVLSAQIWVRLGRDRLSGTRGVAILRRGFRD